MFVSLALNVVVAVVELLVVVDFDFDLDFDFVQLLMELVMPMRKAIYDRVQR